LIWFSIGRARAALLNAVMNLRIPYSAGDPEVLLASKEWLC
jgi:hypothetical protein